MKKVRIWYRDDREKWYGEYWHGGKRHPKAVTPKGPKGKYKTQARQWRDFMQARFGLGEGPGRRETWQVATRLFLQDKQVNRSPATVAELHNSLKMFEKLIGPLRIDLIDWPDIEDFKQKRLQVSGRSKEQSSTARTVNKDLSNLRSFLRWCRKRGMEAKSFDFEMLPETRRQFIPPTESQLNDLLLLSAHEYPPLYMRMVLALETGLRRSAIELVALSDSGPRIDLERNLLVTLESKVHTETVKKLGDNAMRILHGYIAWLPEGSQKLFPDRWDGKARFTWDKLRKRAGVPELTFHNLRGVAVSTLGEKGESKEVLQKVLGHKSYETTERHYFGVRDSESQRVIKKLDDMFADAPCSF